jgi:hypothetical protein
MPVERVGPTGRRDYRANVGILQVLDGLPESVTRSPSQVWSVLARSLGEQGADGRTALAWRWVLTGVCPSPVTLTWAQKQTPDRAQILDEAEAQAALTQQGIDPGGQVMQARSQKAANRAHATLRSPGERANAQLKTWRILRKLRCCPWRAGQLAKAIHVLQTRELQTRVIGG